NVADIDDLCHGPHDHEGGCAGVDIAVRVAFPHEHRPTLADRMDDLLDMYLAVTLDDIEGFLRTKVDMACRRVPVDGHAVGHQMLRAELAVDQPLDGAPIDGKAFDLPFLAQARPTLFQHDLRMIATAKPLPSRRRHN